MYLGANGPNQGKVRPWGQDDGLPDLISDDLTSVRLADDNVARLHSSPTESEGVLPVVTPEAEPCVIFTGFELVRTAADMQSLDIDALHRNRHLQFYS